MSILKSISQFSTLTFLSRIFGLIRDWLFARFFGADGTMDAFLIAFKIPNFFRRLFAEGAFSQVFIPILVGNDPNIKNNKSAYQLSNKQRELASGIAARLYTTVFVFCCLGMILSPWIISLFAPGFAHYPEQSLLSAELLRITFPYLLLITVVALLNGLLNVVGHFATGAALPVILNLCFILATLYFQALFDPPIKVLAVAVFIAGLGQLIAIAWVAHRQGLLILPRWRISPENKQQLRKMGRMLIPALFSVSIIQINLLVDILLASGLSQGSISWLYFGQRLMELPNGVFIVAISTVILPTFSYLLKNQSVSEFSPHVDRAVLLGLFITLPSLLGLVVFDNAIISLLFGGGAFDDTDVINSAKALKAYAFSLPAFMLIKIYSPCFFAYQNTKTPLLCSIIAVMINIALSLLLIQSLAHVGLAIATSIAAWVNALLLYICLIKQGKVLFFQAKIEACKLMIINGIFALGLYQASSYLDNWVDWDKWQQGLSLLGIITISVSIYMLLALLFRLNIKQWLVWRINNKSIDSQ